MRHLLLALVFLLAACGTVHYTQGFDVQKFTTLETGKTTKTDVLALAGPPLARAPGPDGIEVWTYYWTEGKSTAVILPFYYHAETVGATTKIAALTFRGEVLERVEWRP